MAWTQALCDCCGNCCNCAFVFFCPCWSLGKIANHVEDSCCMCTLLSICLLPCLICMERGKMRAKYNIGGGMCGDAVIGFCCPCCGMAQMMHQMEHRAMATDDTVITAQPKSAQAIEQPYQYVTESECDVVCKQPC